MGRCMQFNCYFDLEWQIVLFWVFYFHSIARLSRNISCCNIPCMCSCTEYICIHIHSNKFQNCYYCSGKRAWIYCGHSSGNTSWMLSVNKKWQIIFKYSKEGNGEQNRKPNFSSVRLHFKFCMQIWWSCLAKVTVKLIKSHWRTRRMVKGVEQPVKGAETQ